MAEQTVRTEFVVMFRTKCGCHRTQLMPMPLAPMLDVPLKHKASASAGLHAYLMGNAADKPTKVRRFILEGQDYTNGTAEYLEE